MQIIYLKWGVFYKYKITYKNIVNQTELNKVNKIKRLILAFIGGGSIALIGQAIYDLYYFVFNNNFYIFY